MNKKYILLFLIILLGAFLRFYNLKNFPVQLNHDEVTQLYDAISIAQTGRDIYGNFLPFIFPSIQDFKPPFYTYITSLFYFILGQGELTIRLPGALFGLLIIPAVYFFTLRLFNNNTAALWASFFTAIAPFEIFFSRKSFENGAGIFLMLAGFTAFLTYIEKKDGIKWLYIGSLILGSAFYTYFSHAVILPLLLTAFVIIFRDSLLNNFKKLLVPFLILLVLALPLLVITITNPLARNRSQAVFITQDINLGKEIEHSNKYKTILDFSFTRYLDQFKPTYIFGSGLEFTNQGPLGVGPLLFIQLLFVFLGVIYLIRLPNFSKQKKFVLAWVLLGMLPSGLTFEQHSPHRSIMVFTMLNIFSAFGLFFLFDKVRNFKITFILVIAFILNFVYFIHMYIVNFPFEKSESIHYPFKQVALYAWSVHGSFDQIIFDPLYGEVAPVVGTAAHYYMAYFGNYPPQKFQKEYKLGKKDREVIFDKFSIRKIDWGEDQNLRNVLIIGSSWSLPIHSIEKEKILKTFFYYNGQQAFYAIKL